MNGVFPYYVGRSSSSPAGHFDPSTVPLEQLARMRGSIWTARSPISYGPRRGQPDNILALDFFTLYDAAERARMIADYRARQYWTASIGPFAATDCYHDLYPCHDPAVPGSWPVDDVPSQATWDLALDRIQELWDNGIEPVYFHKPDGWERPEYASRLDRLDALAMQPRAQRLLKAVCYPGWEPSGDKYGWNNDTWRRMCERGARVFPNALRCVHFPCDLDAPTGQNDDQIFPKGEGNAISWRNVAPYVHCFLMQVCGYVNDGMTEEFRREWPKAVRRCVDGFRGGYGWPNYSAFGPGQPIRTIAFEYASYRDFWQNAPESEAREIGDMAMRAGADGYMDGGTLPVGGDTPPPWVR